MVWSLQKETYSNISSTSFHGLALAMPTIWFALSMIFFCAWVGTLGGTGEIVGGGGTSFSIVHLVRIKHDGFFVEGAPGEGWHQEFVGGTCPQAPCSYAPDANPTYYRVRNSSFIYVCNSRALLHIKTSGKRKKRKTSGKNLKNSSEHNFTNTLCDRKKPLIKTNHSLSIVQWGLDIIVSQVQG